MSSIFQTLRSRWFVGVVHAGLWLLLYLAVMGLGGKTVAFREADSFSNPPVTLAPVAKLEQLFSPTVWPKPVADTNAISPFFTRHFIPTQPPAPPIPTTRKIELTYLGFYETGDKPRQVMVKLADAFLVAPLGAKLTANLFVSEASMQAVVLTNAAAQTNLLPLNIKKELEVPIQ